VPLLIERAPAKVNLTLHVLGRRADGYHDLESLVAFAGFGDVLTLEPAKDLSITVDGPAAAGAGPDADNLVLRAAQAFARGAPGLLLGRFRLLKRLPAAAGLGGGSSDAAAALRLLARANGFPRDDAHLLTAAKQVGADVPVCVDPRARVMRGVGDQLGPILSLPPLYGVLANPRVALETRAVFAAMGLKPGEASAPSTPCELSAALGADEFFARLRDARNDMEPAAKALAPEVGETIRLLSDAPGARLARMSGSGATCFALFATRRDARRAAQALQGVRPSWWIKATILR
jgi:4-diphosphocytidyl-2-C-methyl-D-erythritol kinase